MCLPPFHSRELDWVRLGEQLQKHLAVVGLAVAQVKTHALAVELVKGTLVVGKNVVAVELERKLLASHVGRLEGVHPLALLPLAALLVEANVNVDVRCFELNEGGVVGTLAERGHSETLGTLGRGHVVVTLGALAVVVGHRLREIRRGGGALGALEAKLGLGHGFFGGGGCVALDGSGAGVLLLGCLEWYSGWGKRGGEQGNWLHRELLSHNVMHLFWRAIFPPKLKVLHK